MFGTKQRCVLTECSLQFALQPMNKMQMSFLMSKLMSHGSGSGLTRNLKTHSEVIKQLFFLFQQLKLLGFAIIEAGCRSSDSFWTGDISSDR